MTEEELHKFKQYLTWYLEAVEEDTIEYDAALTLLEDIEQGGRFVVQLTEQNQS